MCVHYMYMYCIRASRGRIGQFSRGTDWSIFSNTPSLLFEIRLAFFTSTITCNMYQDAILPTPHSGKLFCNIYIKPTSDLKQVFIIFFPCNNSHVLRVQSQVVTLLDCQLQFSCPLVSTAKYWQQKEKTKMKRGSSSFIR